MLDGDNQSERFKRVIRVGRDDNMNPDVDVDLIKGVLRLLARKGAYLTTSRVQKLFYLIERQCVLDTGERFLGLDYRFDRFGMYSPALSKVVMGLNPKLDSLEVVDIVSEEGSGRTVRWVGRTQRPDDILPERVVKAAAVVLAEYGFLKTKALIEVAKSTSPYIYAKRGEHLYWEILKEERCQEGEALSREGRKRLERALGSIDRGRVREYPDTEHLMEYLLS